MVLYATQPKTLSPADPCNKVPLIRKLVADYDAAKGAESRINEPSPQQN